MHGDATSLMTLQFVVHQELDERNLEEHMQCVRQAGVTSRRHTVCLVCIVNESTHTKWSLITRFYLRHFLAIILSAYKQCN